MRRTIREKEPPRPSTRLSTLPGERTDDDGQPSRPRCAKLVNLLRGDLDWIVMKCLEKDRARRYETANGLAAGYQAAPEQRAGHRPPAQRGLQIPEGLFGETKSAYSAAAAVVLALVAGLSLAAIGLRRALKERNVAEAATAAGEVQRQKAEQAQKNEAALRKEAEEREQTARRQDYASDMRQAQLALASDDLDQARSLLNRHRPAQPGQPDLRGWEWRYLWSQLYRDEPERVVTTTNLVMALAFSGDGRLFEVAVRGRARPERDTIAVTDMLSRRTIWQHTNTSEPAFAHRGALLAFQVGLSPTNSALTMFDMATQKETRLATMPVTNWSYIDFTPNDRVLVGVTEIPGSKSGDPERQKVTAWDVATGRQLWQRGTPEGTLAGYAISPDGNSFAIANWRRSIRVLDMNDGREQLVIPTSAIALSLRFSPDSSQILAIGPGGSSTIEIYDARTGNAAGHLAGHRQQVIGLLFMDGKRLISSSLDSTIRLWDWPSGKLARVLGAIYRKGAPVRLALAPDGRNLASLVVRFSNWSSAQIQLWDLNRPESHPSFQTIGIASSMSSPRLEPWAASLAPTAEASSP